MQKFFLSISILFTTAASAQQKIDFESYNPPSTLVVPEHKISKAKFPFIDIHNHQNRMASMDLNNLTSEMDKMNMRVMVNLSGSSGDQLKDAMKNANENKPGRFLVFANVDFKKVGEPGWGEQAAKQLETDVKNGASGLKIFKSLGFSVKDISGNRVRVDDPRLDAVWKKAGDLKIPVLIHTADPKPFWDSLDNRNERWLELIINPNRKRAADNPVPWETLMNEQHNVFKKHRNTTFIAAHFGWYPNDLAKLSSMLDLMPNVMVEFGAVIAEIGRQPKMAKEFFTKYQDRILFGKDSWVPSEYGTYFRVLETADEYFPYHKKYHAYWAMYGMGLSDNILKKVYYKNALRILPNINKSGWPE